MGLGRWVAGDFVYVTEKKAESLSSNLARPGDIVFTQRGTLGQVAIIPKSSVELYVISQSQMKLTVDPKKADPLFVYYVFTSEAQLAHITNNAIQTGVPHTNLTFFRNTPLSLPPLPEQKAIAHILGSLDDKIELNRRMNGTLEGMAQALFKSWFVDFDPVIDNALAAGNPLPDELAEGAGWAERVEARRQALANGSANRQAAQAFPAAFHETEAFGWIPSGWQVRQMGEVVEVTDGRHDSPKPVTEGFPLITSKHLNKWTIDFDNAYLISEEDFVRRNVGRTVCKYDILISLIGTVGTLYFVMEDKNPYSIKNIGLFKSSQAHHISEYLYLFLDSDYAKHYLASRMAGTTQSYLTHASLRAIPVIVPPEQIIRLFRQSINPLFSKIHANIQQMQTLGNLRDTLLPKLISGELRIPDAEKLAEEALA